MAFDDVADEGRLTIAVGARQVELAAAIHSAIAIIVSMVLEFPLIGHQSPLSGRATLPLEMLHAHRGAMGLC